MLFRSSREKVQEPKSRGRPWGQQVHRLPYLPTGWRAGQCRPVSQSMQEGPRWELQVASLCYSLPWVGPAATQLCYRHRAGAGGRQAQLQATPSLGKGGRALGAAALPVWGRHGSGGPWGQGEVAGQWLGGWQREPRQAGPSLGAGPGWGHIIQSYI